MTHETEQVFIGKDGDAPGRFHVTVKTGNVRLYGVITANSADEARRLAVEHIGGTFCKVESIIKCLDNTNLTADNCNGLPVNFIIDNQDHIEAYLDKNLKVLCQKWSNSDKCDGDCENCAITTLLEAIAEDAESKEDT